MADVDSLSIKISASSEAAAKSIQALADSMRKLKEASKTAISQTTVNALTKMVDALRAVTTEDLNKFNRMSKALERLSAVSRAKIPKDLADNLFNIGQAVRAIPDDAVERLGRMTSALQRLQNVRMRDVASSLRRAVTGEQMTAQDSGTERVASVTERATVEQTAESVRRLSRNWDTARNAVRGVASVTKTVAGSVWQIAKASIGSQLSRMFNAAIGPAKKFASALGNVVSGFKRILFYRTIRRIIKEIGDAVREGTNHLYQWAAAVGDSFKTSMDSAATSLHYFKDSIGAALSPIIQAFIPALNSLIDKVVEAINWINQLFAKLTGQSYWTRAKRTATEYAAAASGAGAAAKEALKYLMPFDELNVLPKENASGGGGGGGGEDYSQEFENVDLSDKFKWVDTLKDKLKGIWDVFKKAWANEGENTINALKNALNAVWELVKAIGRSFYEVFTNGTGQHTIETILRIFQNILGTIEAIATKLRMAWEENETGTKIIQNIWDTFNLVLDTIEQITAATKAWAWDLDFSPLLTSIEELTGAFKELVRVISGYLVWAWENVLLPLGKWVIEVAAPNSVRLLASAFQFLTTVLSVLKPILTWIYEKLVRPLVIFILNKAMDIIAALKALFDFLSDCINKAKILIPEFFDLIKQKVETWKESVKEKWNNFADQTELRTQRWKDNIKAHWNEFAEKSEERTRRWKENLSTTFTTFKEDTIATFNKVKEKVVEAFEKTRDGIKAAINGILGFVEGMANGVVRGINKVISALNGINVTIPSWVPGVGGNSFGLDIGYLSEVSIPRLEKGGFPEDGLFLANHNELVGGFANGKTAVANNEQIIAGIERGVSNANEDVVETILTVAGQIVQAIRENDKGISLDDIARGVTQWQNRRARAYGM